MNPPKTDWKTVDWSCQDSQLAQRFGVSRECVRQNRVRLGVGKSPNHRFRAQVGRPVKTVTSAVWILIIPILARVQEQKDARSRATRKAAWIRGNDRRKGCPKYREQRRLYAVKRRRAEGVRTKAEWLAAVTKSLEWHRENKRRLKRLEYAKRVKNRKYVFKYRPEPRGKDGSIPKYTQKVLSARRKEYIRWWKSVVPALGIEINRANHLVRVAAMKAEAKKRREYKSWWRQLLYERDIQLWRRQGKIKEAFRKTVRKAIRNRDGKRMRRYIGCSSRDLCRHLESQFKPSWTWENYGKKWNVDHIVPLSKFDLSQTSHVKIACHYTNLRPMACWANHKKSDKITRAVQPCLPLESPVLMAA